MKTLYWMVTLINLLATSATADTQQKTQPLIQKARNGSISCSAVKHGNHYEYYVSGPSIGLLQKIPVLQCIAKALNQTPKPIATAEVLVVTQIQAKIDGTRCYKVDKEYILKFRDEIPDNLEQQVVACYNKAEERRLEKIRDPRWI